MKFTVQAAIINLEEVLLEKKNQEILRRWKEAGVQMAGYAIHSDPTEIAQVAGIIEHFDYFLARKPVHENNPDQLGKNYFIQAAERLNISPRQILIVGTLWEVLPENTDFTVVRVSIGPEESQAQTVRFLELEVRPKKSVEIEALPSALEKFEDLGRSFHQSQPLLFLDFDGTLSPIVTHHEDAVISDQMRILVERVSRKFPVAVISGRGLADVRKRVDLSEIYYAGSHGFEISGPDGFSQDHQEAVKVLPVFNEIEPLLKEQLKSFTGVDFERKKFTLAIHYRQVDANQEGAIHESVSQVLRDFPEVAKAEGKKVIEIRPAIDWHKGKAMEFLRKHLTQKPRPYFMYIGDDVTDEDAFGCITYGSGILVGSHGKKTFADFHLKDIDEVHDFLNKMLDYAPVN